MCDPRCDPHSRIGWLACWRDCGGSCCGSVPGALADSDTARKIRISTHDAQPTMVHDSEIQNVDLSIDAHHLNPLSPWLQLDDP